MDFPTEIVHKILNYLSIPIRRSQVETFKLIILPYKDEYRSLFSSNRIIARYYDITEIETIYETHLSNIKSFRLVCVSWYIPVDEVINRTQSDFGNSYYSAIIRNNMKFYN